MIVSTLGPYQRASSFGSVQVRQTIDGGAAKLRSNV